MKLPKMLTSRRRVGVVGLYRSGKTVFLTSLINHLQNHRPDQLRLGKGDVRIIFAGEKEPDRFKAFPYLEHRNRLLKSRQWPIKTRDISEYRCRYQRSDWRLHEGEISLVDFPGERLADLMMAEASYGQWSDLITAILRNHEEYASHAEGYLNALQGEAVSEDEVLGRYRQLLLTLFDHFLPVISPSTFLLTPEGKWLGDLPAEKRMTDAFCGLDAARQFAPLPKEMRSAYPELTKQFEKRYEEYRRQIAIPIFRWMKSCDALTVLLDVTSLLAGGVGMYDGNKELLKLLIERLRPGRTYFGLSMDLLSKAFLEIPSWLAGLVNVPDWKTIKKVLFVSTKADKVHQVDRDRLQNLVRDMTEPLIAPHEARTWSLEVGYFVCAAVNSTRSGEGRKLQAYRGESEEAISFVPSEVPEGWPANWNQGDYRFPNVDPWLPRRRDAAPDQIGLDGIIDFLMR